MTITRNYNGSVTISDIVDDQYVKITYYDYTMYEAKKRFKEHLKTIKKDENTN